MLTNEQKVEALRKLRLSCRRSKKRREFLGLCGEVICPSKGISFNDAERHFLTSEINQTPNTEKSLHGNVFFWKVGVTAPRHRWCTERINKYIA